MMRTTISTNIYVDHVKNCIILTNDDGFPSESVTVRSVIRAIRRIDLMSWKELSTFLGVGKSSSLFKIYLSRNKVSSVSTAIAKQLFITPDKKEIHLYAAGHAPVEGEYPPYVKVSIDSNEGDMTIHTKIPTRVFTRTEIVDPLDRCLTLTITPTNGYIVDDKSTRITTTGALFTASGRPKALNRLLGNLFYVGSMVGESSIIMSVNDGLNTEFSVISHTITVNNTVPKVISVPTLSLTTVTASADGEAEGAIVGQPHMYEGLIQVADDDNKILGLRVTPFDCEVYGFTTTSEIFKRGDIFNISGMPDYINEVVANLRITPLAPLAHLGVELRSIDPTGSTTPLRIQEYLEIHAWAPEVNEEVTPPQIPEPVPTQDVMVEDEVPTEWPAEGVDDDGLLIVVEDTEDAPQADADATPEEAPQNEFKDVLEWAASNPEVKAILPHEVITPEGFEAVNIETGVQFVSPNIADDTLPIVFGMAIPEGVEITQMNLATTVGDIGTWDFGVVENGEFVLVQAYGSFTSGDVVFPEPISGTTLAIRVRSITTTPEGELDPLTLGISLYRNNKHYAYTPVYLLP